MKLRKLFSTLLFASITLTFWACTEPADDIAIDSGSTNGGANIENLMGASSIMDRVRSVGFGTPIGAFFNNEQTTTRGGGSATPLETRNVRIGNEQLNASDFCMTETYEDDGQGNYVYTIDFGDGCDYYGEFLKGKMIEEGTNSETDGETFEESFTAKITYVNFGGEDWTINGTTQFEGTWSEAFNEDLDEYVFESTYSHVTDLVEEFIEFADWEEDSVSVGEEMITVQYIASGTETENNAGYTVSAASEEVAVSTGETFTSTVTIPLYYDFGCEDQEVWVFVSGREEGTYSYMGEFGEFSVDYGDGSCDNVITVTENGQSEEIDLEEEWEEWEEDCEGDHDEEDEEDEDEEDNEEEEEEEDDEEDEDE